MCLRCQNMLLCTRPGSPLSTPWRLACWRRKLWNLSLFCFCRTCESTDVQWPSLRNKQQQSNKAQTSRPIQLGQVSKQASVYTFVWRRDGVYIRCMLPVTGWGICVCVCVKGGEPGQPVSVRKERREERKKTEVGNVRWYYWLWMLSGDTQHYCEVWKHIARQWQWERHPSVTGQVSTVAPLKLKQLLVSCIGPSIQLHRVGL